MVQECFLSLLENEKLLKKLGDPDSPATRGYLVMMVKSKAINLYHKIKKQKDVINDDENLLYRIEDANSNTEKILANAEMLMEARQSLNLLDPMEINIMILKYYAGFQNTEIAAILKIDSNLVGVKLHRAKKKLAAEIERNRKQKEAANHG